MLPNEFLGAVARAAIGVDNDRPSAREILQQASPDGLHHLSDGCGIVVRGHADDDIYFTDIHQLTDEIIGKDGCFRQNYSPFRSKKSECRSN